MAYWGKQWLMIANPTYGSFDTSTYGHDFKKPLAEQRKAKWDVLELLGRPQAVEHDGSRWNRLDASSPVKRVLPVRSRVRLNQSIEFVCR